MGVGVFSSDFRGTGDTFLVSGNTLSEEDYRKYIEESESEDDLSVLSFEEWISLENEYEYTELVNSIQEACKELGMYLPEMQERYIKRGPEGFIEIAEEQGVSIGLRQWEHDYVVGVWQDEKYGEDWQSFANEIAYEEMLPPQVVVDSRAKLANDILEFVRHRLQHTFGEDAGFECRFKTSGYTSSRYEPLLGNDLEVRTEQLKTSIKKTFDDINKPMGDRIATWIVDDLKQILEAIKNEGYYQNVRVPMIDQATGEMIFLDPNRSIDHFSNERFLDEPQIKHEGLHVDQDLADVTLRFVPLEANQTLFDVCKKETHCISAIPGQSSTIIAPAALWVEATGGDLEKLSVPLDDVEDEDDASDGRPTF